MDDHNDFFLDEPAEPATSPASKAIDFTSPTGSTVIPEKPRRRGRRFLVWLIFIVCLILGGVFYVRYLNPYAVKVRATGYVTSIEQRGIFFKTFEATMATEASMGDTTRVYTRDLTFTVPSDSLATIIQDLSTPPARRITIVYERYYGTLPWRGSSKNVVTAVL